MSDNKKTPVFSAYHDNYVVIPFENVDAVDGELMGTAEHTLSIVIYLKNNRGSIALDASCGARAFMDQYKAYLRVLELNQAECLEYGGPR